MGVLISWVVTQFFIFFTWLIFRVEDTAVLIPSMKTFVGWGATLIGKRVLNSFLKSSSSPLPLQPALFSFTVSAENLVGAKNGLPGNILLYGAPLVGLCYVWRFTSGQQKRLISFISDFDTGPCFGFLLTKSYTTLP